MIVPLAHLGHVLVDLPIFFGPVAVLAGWMVFLSRRDRRRGDADDSPSTRAREQPAADAGSSASRP